MIKYLNDKNCDTIKEIYRDCLEAFCCCFAKSEDNNFNRIAQDEANAAVVLRPVEQPDPVKPKDNESVAKPGGASTSAKTPASPKSNNIQLGNLKGNNNKDAGKDGNKEPAPNTPEGLFVALLKEDANDIKWTKKEAGPTKKAIKGLVNLLSNYEHTKPDKQMRQHYDFNVQASFNAVLAAQEKAIKTRNFPISKKIRDELEKEIPLAQHTQQKDLQTPIPRLWRLSASKSIGGALTQRPKPHIAALHRCVGFRFGRGIRMCA